MISEGIVPFHRIALTNDRTQEASLNYEEIRQIYTTYSEMHPSYVACTSTCDVLIKKLLEPMSDKIVQISSRTKEPTSLRHKLIRKKGYRSLDEVTDLCGVRIITYLKEDAEAVCEMIENEFEVDRNNSVDKSVSENPSQFGYKSVHYIVSLGGGRHGLPEYAPMADQRVEVQVRTVLQHAWAAIEHKLVYKSAKETPKQLRRQLSRLSALLEIGDDEFSRVMSQSNELSAGYEAEIAKGNLDLEINIGSLRSFFETLPVTSEWAEVGKTCGFKDLEYDFEDGDRFEGYSRVVQVANHCGIATLADLHDRLQDAEKESSAALRLLVEWFNEHVGDFGNYPLIAASLSLVFLYRKDITKSDFYSFLFAQEIDWGVFEIFELEGDDPYEDDGDEVEEDDEEEDLYEDGPEEDDRLAVLRPQQRQRSCEG